MNYNSEIENNEYFIDLFEWEFPDLFKDSFHSFLDSMIEEASGYLDDIIPEKTPLSRKDAEKLNMEYTYFLWKMLNNKVKYYFQFKVENFVKFVSLSNESENELFRRLILSFQTEELIGYILNNVMYRQFMSASPISIYAS